MAHAQSDLGHVEILVNNAGIQHVAPVQDFEEEKWNDLIAVRCTLRGPVRLMHAALASFCTSNRVRDHCMVGAVGTIASGAIATIEVCSAAAQFDRRDGEKDLTLGGRVLIYILYR